MTDVKCPYCTKQLPKVPKRKTGCIFCCKNIHVRSKQDIFPGRILFTKDEAGAVDWLRKLELSRRDFESERDRLSLHHGVQANPRDIVYSLMNQLLMKYGQPPNFDQLKMVYFQMALFLHEERRNPFKLKQEAIKSDLSKWRKQAEKGSLDLERNRVKVITCGSDSCAECRKLNGATFHLDEAFEKMPIPVRACAKWSEENSYGWCRCEYALIALHDEDELEPL